MEYEYLYVYRDENTVIQLYRKSKNIYVLSNGWETIDFNLFEERNVEARQGLKEGRKKVYMYDKEGDEYEVYTSANAAFGLE